MSTDNNTITYGSYDPQQEKDLLEAASSIKREARKDSAFFAKKNRPTLTEPSILPYVGRYKTAYEEVLAKELGKIKPEVHETKFNRFREDKTAKEKAIDERTGALDHENSLDLRALDGKTKPEEKKRNPLFAVLLGFIYAGEMYYNALAFAFLGGNMAGAYLIGATVTLIEGILAYAIGRNLARMEEGGHKSYLQTGIYVLLDLGIVVAMSTLRAKMSDSTSLHTPAWVFFLVNVAFLAGSIVFSKLFFPSQKQKDADRDVLDRHARIAEREEEIKKLKGEKEALEKNFKQEEERYLFVMSQARRTSERVEAHYRETVELFKTENLITRSDLGTPVCFFEPIPALLTSKNE